MPEGDCEIWLSPDNRRFLEDVLTECRRLNTAESKTMIAQLEVVLARGKLIGSGDEPEGGPKQGQGNVK